MALTPWLICDDPVLPGTAATDYERYLRTDELLSLQKTAAEVVHRDEHLFQAVHQASELWLKLACLEIEAATALVDDDKAAAATRLLRRACDAMLLITNQLAHAGAHVALRLRHRPHGARPRRGLRLAGIPRGAQDSPLLGEAFDGCSRGAASRSSTSTSAGTTSRSSISSPSR